MKELGDPHLGYPVVCPSINDTPRLILEKNNDGSGRPNCLLPINVSVLAWWQAPDHRYRWASGGQHGDIPGCFDLGGHNKYRAFLRLILLDQNQGQSWLAITVEVNLDQTGQLLLWSF